MKIAVFPAYEANWTGILRIALWTVLFLFVFSTLLQKLIPTSNWLDDPKLDNEKSTNPNIIRMKLEGADLKWTRQDIPKEGVNNIAWITDSSATISDPSGGRHLLPADVLRAIKEKYNSSPNVLLYQVSGRRESDTYMLLLDALSQKPDMIVLSLNPFWLFNGHSIASGAHYGTALNNCWRHMDSWPIPLLITPPSATAFSLVGANFSLFRDNLGYYRSLVALAKGLYTKPEYESLITEKHKDYPNKPKHVSLIAGKHFDTPLLFWFDFRDFPHEGDFIPRVWLENNLVKSNPANAFWNNYFLKLAFNRLSEANTHTLIYLSPIDPMLLENETYSNKHLLIKNTLKNYAATLPTHIKVVTDIPDEIVTTIEFQDFYHNAESGSLPDYLAQLIKEIRKNNP